MGGAAVGAAPASSSDWSSMRAHRPLVFALALSAAALTSACTERKPEPSDPAKEKTTSASQPATWDGKEDAEDAMRRATRALNAVEPESAARQDSDTTNLAKGLDTTFTTQGKKPYTFDIACQSP